MNHSWPCHTTFRWRELIGVTNPMNFSNNFFVEIIFIQNFCRILFTLFLISYYYVIITLSTVQIWLDDATTDGYTKSLGKRIQFRSYFSSKLPILLFFSLFASYIYIYIYGWSWCSGFGPLDKERNQAKDIKTNT